MRAAGHRNPYFRRVRLLYERQNISSECRGTKIACNMVTILGWRRHDLLLLKHGSMSRCRAMVIPPFHQRTPKAQIVTHLRTSTPLIDRFLASLSVSFALGSPSDTLISPDVIHQELSSNSHGPIMKN